MAIYNLRVSPSNGRSVVRKFNYINREEEYSYLLNDKYDDFIYSENINMPSFATDNPVVFWESVEEYERVNANLFREIEFSIPHELNEEERIEIATEFARKLFKDEYVYSLAIHNKKSSLEDIDNIHCHIIFSERKLDGIERNEEQFFKRFNSKNPSLGGCQKIDWSRKAILYDIRKEWENIANQYLEKYNTQITSDSLIRQRLNALLEENYLKAEMFDRESIHLNLRTYKYSYDCEYRRSAIKYLEDCRKIKAYKEKLYKLRCENFEEENEKAKQRLINGEVEKFDFSDFDMEKEELVVNQELLQQTQETVNNIITNNISILENNRKIEELNSISDSDIEETAFNILTNNEYADKLIRLEKLQDFYDRTPIKENFIYKKELAELNNYFIELSLDRELQERVFILKDKLINDNREIVDKLITRNNELKNENSLNNKNIAPSVETRKALEEKFDELVATYRELKQIKNDIHMFIDTDMNRDKILLDIYKNMNKENLVEKYNNLISWKEEFNSNTVTDTVLKEELKAKIKDLETGFMKYNLVNNIDVQVDSIIEIKKDELTKLLDKKYKLENKLEVTDNLLSTYSDYISTGAKEDIKEVIEEYNYENVFKTSIDVEVLINKHEQRIKQIQTITNEDIENRALNILTKNEFSKNLKELNRLQELYENTPIKENFVFKLRKQELEDYFEKLNNNEYFQNKLSKMKDNIKEKYNLEKENIGEELNNLRHSQYKNIHKEISNESTVLTKIIQRESFNSLTDLYKKSSIINKKVKDYKVKLDKDNILLEIYKDMNKENLVEKYKNLISWKEEFNSNTITDTVLKEELKAKIKDLETGFMKYNIANNINEKLDEILEVRKKEYKSLRQEQDDIQGKIKYLTDITKVLKEKMKDVYNQDNLKLKLEYDTLVKQDDSKEIPSIEKLYNKLLYNSKIEDLELSSKNKLDNLESSKFKLELSAFDKKDLREMIVANINKLVEENRILEKEPNLEILKDDKSLEKYILDNKTNKEYSKELDRIEFYNNQIAKKIDIRFYENAITETQKRIDILIKNNPITNSEKEKYKASIRSKSISSITKVHMNKKQIRLLYSSLKQLNSDNIKVTDLISSAFNKLAKATNNTPKEYNYDKKLYVLGVDRIVVEEEDIVEKERKKILWESSHSR